jgi:hypothetical protein
MVAPKGNQFWKARATHGREKTFSSPEMLWDACLEYFQWVEDNPLKEAKAFNVGGEVKIIDIAKMRAMTIDGLCTFLDITTTTWYEYKHREDDQDFSGIITRVEQIIKDQKFTGAAADLLNANIIARDLGLSDKKEVTQKSTVKVDATMNATDAARAYQDLMGDD